MIKQLLLLFFVLNAALPGSAAEPPKEWIDPDTGHRVVRLSSEPGSLSPYFHQYPFSADGKWLAISTRRGISRVNLQTHEVDSLVEGSAWLLLTGRRTGDVYYRQLDGVFAVNFETKQSRLVVQLPEEYYRAQVAPNADETLLVGFSRDESGERRPRSEENRRRGGRLGGGWAAGEPLQIFTMDLATKQIKTIHRGNDWFNHLQTSPTDPNQILFCHEGPWHFVDRTWLIKTDGSGLTKVHPRTMDMEIFGHEFFSQDGAAVWYDLQTPRSMVFWLAGYEIATGKRTWYHLEREEWSVHYNISPDGKLFCGDGGGEGSVANRDADGRTLRTPGNGKWMWLFRPKLIGMRGLPEAAAKQIQIGDMESERLVSLRDHDYDLEPNGIFTPDGKWVIFRSNMHGPSHVYAVEVAKN